MGFVLRTGWADSVMWAGFSGSVLSSIVRVFWGWANLSMLERIESIRAFCGSVRVTGFREVIFAA
jgi:hypothetical protein